MVTTVDIHGVPHAYELTAPTGSPTVLVFVHGWLLSREYWQPVISRISPLYPCLAYDLRGFGDSQPNDRPSLKQSEAIAMRPSRLSKTMVGVLDKDSSTRYDSTQYDPTQSVEARSGAIAVSVRSGYSPAAYAADLIELLHQLNISSAWLVGHSLGGSIALWAADLAPGLVEGVICINSGGGIYLKAEFERFRAAGQQLVQRRPRWLCHLPLIDLLMTRMNVAAPIDRVWGRQRLLDLVRANPEAALGTLMDSTTESEVHSLPQVVSRLQQPVHFIAGAEDTIMEPQYVSHLASFHASFQCRGDNVTEIPSCGHLAMVEQPDQVAAQIRSLLSQHDSAS
jgi:2-succinyl-6-hydroxy-2,4-cyclohexadiene-1-carboxylate synthase